MNFTDDFFGQAQKSIEVVFRANRATLMAANGTAEHQVKDDKTTVTEFDKQMELDLKRALLPLDAGIGYEGEEFGREGSRQTFWLVDPIDGTENFIRGLPFFRSMATLIDGGRPVFAVVYRVLDDELFVAKKGKGAYRNSVRLQISPRPLDRLRLEISTKYQEKTVGPVIHALAEHVEGLRTADEFLYVAEGKLDAHLVYKSDTKPWDNAPRMLLLAEAGAKVAQIGNATADYDYRQGDWLAANPAVFDELLGIINKAAAVGAHP